VEAITNEVCALNPETLPFWRRRSIGQQLIVRLRLLRRTDAHHVPALYFLLLNFAGK